MWEIQDNPSGQIRRLNSGLSVRMNISWTLAGFRDSFCRNFKWIFCYSNSPYSVVRTLMLKCDGTWWRTGGEVKGKLANGVCSQYSSHYLGTRCIQHYCHHYRWCHTPRLPAVDWTNLNALVRFAERPDLVSAGVPSHFNWPLHLLGYGVNDRGIIFRLLAGTIYVGSTTCIPALALDLVLGSTQLLFKSWPELFPGK